MSNLPTRSLDQKTPLFIPRLAALTLNLPQIRNFSRLLDETLLKRSLVLALWGRSRVWNRIIGSYAALTGFHFLPPPSAREEGAREEGRPPRSPLFFSPPKYKWRLSTRSLVRPLFAAGGCLMRESDNIWWIFQKGLSPSSPLSFFTPQAQVGAFQVGGGVPTKALSNNQIFKYLVEA